MLTYVFLPIIHENADTLIVLSSIYAVSIIEKVKFTEGVHTGGVLDKKLFLKIFQYSQENSSVGVSFLIKLQALSPATLLKRDSRTVVFQ